MMAADGDCHHLCKLMAPVRHRWSINDVIGGIRNTVMPSDCSPPTKGQDRSAGCWPHAEAEVDDHPTRMESVSWEAGGKRPLGRPRRRWEANIKMDLREMGYNDRDWVNLAQDRDQWRAYVRAAMNLRVP
ncbi:hypothetical protein ANN_15283 [Periplaneta americana]|uniref:Uncharacterized protein n=1 Tax=Periplaneta americana TaxID=6978 RepID=A0ABQ8SH45_PERAM|nr:hypothetical protein ANN_15283 [Periplaneta americana]